MTHVIVWICVAAFATTAVITLLALTGRIKLGRTRAAHDIYLKQLFRALVVEVVVVAVGAFAAYLRSPKSGAAKHDNALPPASVSEKEKNKARTRASRQPAKTQTPPTSLSSTAPSAKREIRLSFSDVTFY
jgi:hypothetical protein